MATQEIRPIRVKGNVAYVALTKGYEAIIDAIDVPLVAGRNWCSWVARRPDGTIKTVYAVSRAPIGNGKRRTIYMHRLISAAPSALEVDHADGDGLNNVRNNLRTATKAQNAHNQRMAINNTSGVKGVSFSKAKEKWLVRITVNNRRLVVGHFSALEDAAAAYASASALLHGDFGRTA